MKVLFLYTELAGYFLKCCEELSRNNEVHIVHWPVNSEAPFIFTFPASLKVYNKKDYTPQSLTALVKEIAPEIIICSGWIDKDYLRIVGSYRKRIPAVLALDTHWKASPKQFVAVLLSRFFLLGRFTHAWVPGGPQENYARKLGFAKNKIKRNFYCCDLSKFNKAYEETKSEKAVAFPRRFIYVGRYYEFKGLGDLWKAFIGLESESPTGWELWCLGTGDMKPAEHPSIKHFGFVQPEQLGSFVKSCGVFILPSRYEPWAVAVQEYAASGFPLVLSSEVGAAEIFLREGSNGFSFKAGDVSALKRCLKKITELSTKELFLMAETSHQLAQQITPSQWSRTVGDIYNEFYSK